MQPVVTKLGNKNTVSLEDTSQLWCVLESSGSLSRMEALLFCSLRLVIFNSNKYSESFAYEYYGSELLSSDQKCFKSNHSIEFLHDFQEDGQTKK